MTCNATQKISTHEIKQNNIQFHNKQFHKIKQEKEEHNILR